MRRRVRLVAALAVTAVATALAVVTFATSSGSARQVCAYSASKISQLRRFGRIVGRDIECAEVFNDTAPDWTAWERPWFLSSSNPDQYWAGWVRAHKGRQLVISQSLFPAMLNGTDWLDSGARGQFAGHARALATNLVAAGLGHAIIRLAPEANGTWQPYSVGPTAREQKLWRSFWRITALAMRSVNGAHFRFDWTVNAAIRPLPLAAFYPGDDVVDIVGVDIYDFDPQTGTGPWLRTYRAPDSGAQVVAFAKAHHKRVSIPEWGTTAKAGTDDPAFVNGIAGLTRTGNVAYQAYFFAHDSAGRLVGDPKSLSAYRRHFGDHGDSAGG